MTKDAESGLVRTRDALSSFRKQMQEIEAARSAATALLTAAARGDEATAAVMAQLIADAVQKLASRVAALTVAMDVVVKAAAPEPVKVVKPKAA